MGEPQNPSVIGILIDIGLMVGGFVCLVIGLIEQDFGRMAFGISSYLLVIVADIRRKLMPKGH